MFTFFKNTTTTNTTTTNTTHTPTPIYNKILQTHTITNKTGNTDANTNANTQIFVILNKIY